MAPPRSPARAIRRRLSAASPAPRWGWRAPVLQARSAGPGERRPDRDRHTRKKSAKRLGEEAPVTPQGRFGGQSTPARLTLRVKLDLLSVCRCDHALLLAGRVRRVIDGDAVPHVHGPEGHAARQ
jgi:hypothetical protein